MLAYSLRLGPMTVVVAEELLGVALCGLQGLPALVLLEKGFR
jgi:hypothetical protein